MNKNISWKVSLGIAAVCYFLKFTMGAYLPNLILTILEIVGIITLISGIVGGLKEALKKNKKHE